MHNKHTRKWWEVRGDSIPPPEYDECYIRELRRMAAALNCYNRSGAPFSPTVIKKSDIALRDLFVEKKIGSVNANAALVNHELINRAQVLEDFDQAENLFYGDFDFRCPRGFKNIVRVTHRSTPAFRKWSFEQLSWPTIEAPQGEPAPVKKRRDETDAEFMMSCGSNYLLKNFWHNYVHRQLQGIGSQNYHNFGGEARDHSDFTADNLATILLIRSYGIHVLTSGRSMTERSTAVRDLLTRNRCNLVFAERDRRRIDKTTAIPVHERWQEAQWQFRRRVATAISKSAYRDWGCGHESCRVSPWRTPYAGRLVFSQSERRGRDQRPVLRHQSCTLHPGSCKTDGSAAAKESVRAT